MKANVKLLTGSFEVIHLSKYHDSAICLKFMLTFLWLSESQKVTIKYAKHQGMYAGGVGHIRPLHRDHQAPIMVSAG
jgi:hypothetical protein